jgi:choline dehydrogenase-like flavoprotein
LIPQNIQAQSNSDEKAFGYSSMGCQYGQKQSTLKACLETAFERGCRFVVNTEIEKILIENGQAIGAKAWQTKANGQKIGLRIRAKKVIVAAGSIHTPAILLRSGLQHPHIGQHLNLHPVLAVSAMYQEDINPWWGMMMTTVNDQYANLDGNFGVRIETPPVHSGLMGLSLPWLSGKQHKQIMQNGKHIGSFIVLTRDRFGGRVILDKKGNAQIEYKINPYDRAHLLEGVAAATELHLAAGAQKVMLPHHSYPAYDSIRKIAVRAVLKNLSWKPNLYSLFSAHQMSSCRMGGNSKTHPIAPNGETYEVRNLFVADASAFPSCSGVNPMLSIQALAHFIGRNWV